MKRCRAEVLTDPNRHARLSHAKQSLKKYSASNHYVILFYRCSFHLLFSPPNLRDRLADHYQTLPHGRRWPRFMKFGQTFGGPLPPEFGGPKHQISARFRTTSRLDREYLRNATRHRQSENGVANYGHSRITKLNSVTFRCTLVHKRRKIGPKFWLAYRP